MSAEKPQPTQQQGGQQQPPKLTVDEQVSLLLAHFNRANNSVAKEAESALIKVVSQVMEVQKKYFELSEEFTKYKADHPDVKGEPKHTTENNPPKNSK
jgi:hypothetical protein